MESHGQERLSPEAAPLVKVQVRKGRKIQISAVSHQNKKKPVFWLSMVARWCPMLFGDASWSLDDARGLPGGFRAQRGAP